MRSHLRATSRVRRVLLPALGIFAVTAGLLAGGLFVNASPAIANSVTAVDPVTGLTVTQTLKKTSAGAPNVLRAGDIVQVSGSISNPSASGHEWTVGEPLTFTTNLADLIDDAALLKVQEGSISRCENIPANSSSCRGVEPQGDVAAFKFALKSGAKHYYSYQVQVRNSYTNDRMLRNVVRVSGTGVDLTTGGVSAQVALEHPDLELSSKIVNMTDPSSMREIRAGDELEVRVQIHNPGDGDWVTSTDKTPWLDDRPVTFNSDIAGLADDAVVTGMRYGASTRCAVWDDTSTVCTKVLTPSSGEFGAISFGLKSKATYYVTYQLNVRNTYSAERQLEATFNASGLPGNGQEPVSASHEVSAEVSEERPEIAVSSKVVNMTDPSSTRGIRAGDELEVRVQIHNPGDGDWVKSTDKTPWLHDRPVTFTSNIAGLTDDAVVTGMRYGASTRCAMWDDTSTACTKVLTPGNGEFGAISFGLKSKATYYVTYQLHVRNDYAGDQKLEMGYSANGNPGNGHGVIKVDGSESVLMEVQFPKLAIEKTVKRVSGNLQGDLKAGDVLEYRVNVTNPGPGDWTTGNAVFEDRQLTFTDDLSDVLDDAVWVRGSLKGCDRDS